MKALLELAPVLGPVNLLSVATLVMCYKQAKSERHLWPDIAGNPIWLLGMWGLLGPAITLFVLINSKP